MGLLAFILQLFCQTPWGKEKLLGIAARYGQAPAPFLGQGPPRPSIIVAAKTLLLFFEFGVDHVIT
jgi:hypothetical protein